MSDTEQLKSRFRETYGQDAEVYRAPGRVNLIGEHTDYNEGFVFPAAIDMFTWVAIAPRDDFQVRVASENLHQAAEFGLTAESRAPNREWHSYVSGVALVLHQNGYRLKGANILICSNVPVGSGLSSSAALEVAVGFALLANSGLSIDRERLARLCQRAENEFVGMRCGIMDQLASACCRRGNALLLDCRSLGYRMFHLPPNLRLVICNTMVKRELAASAYNERRAECEEGVRILARRFPEVRALRDATMEQLEACRAELTPVVFKRCRHVITEDERVTQAADALEHNRIDDLRSAMAESHRSLRDDYEVSCSELDLLVELASRIPGVAGARMTGAGFGGCTINLVEATAVEHFRSEIAAEYQQRTKLNPDIYVCTAADGVRLAY
jgi:galactokinase